MFMKGLRDMVDSWRLRTCGGSVQRRVGQPCLAADCVRRREVEEKQWALV